MSALFLKSLFQEKICLANKGMSLFQYFFVLALHLLLYQKKILYDKQCKDNIYLCLQNNITYINYYNLNMVSFKNFYSYSNILVNDFYYIYNLYFEKQILLTIFSLFIITIYSIFFILLYYNLRFFSLKSSNIKKKIYLLRKQNLIHQNNYNTKIRLFKNKN